MEILKLLEDHHVVKDYEVEDFRVWADGGYYKIGVGVADGTVLQTSNWRTSQLGTVHALIPRSGM